MLNTKMYTPEQVADMLQLSKNTIYDLINRGEIVAKKIGRVYRVPRSSIEYVFTGLDQDLLKAEDIDKQNIFIVVQALTRVRKSL
ncbi:hypothetical protein COU88_01225 [Candidatus Roizmanbacteria bacterium CG10_big_fil_rev_8_21_14_0_10_39_6]|uniref:Helix-turn-helix domain-containing protein n=1 Tax=Candidatus Roizmanbacteria bacterium CG10_big_fil_rev_8_21_14_0_10_39_6 TaxID=1974853 RepID=A0A2M8KT71_9BACT|nr:MAG: hypothetical protein COU88_01225 [Candidatus Roizmanbacteria bacterium CG10_big_fil_rev_8_21_14_0_10_39_6]